MNNNNQEIKNKFDKENNNTLVAPEEQDISSIGSRKLSKLWVFLAFIFAPLVIILSFVAYAVIISYYSDYSGPGNRLFKEIPYLSSAFENNSGGQTSISKNKTRRLLDGVYVDFGRENPPPVAVVIDNHPDAYPQTGLTDAQLVYEAPVEGATTRFLAVFTTDSAIDQIGPVRSARPYFIDWVNELSSCFSHCGGSPEALAKVIKDNILDMNEFYQGTYFWRASDRTAPYNVITSMSNLNRYMREKGLDEGKYFYWRFKDDQPAGERPASTTLIEIPEFSVSWEYDSVENNYLRYMRGELHKDTLGLPVKAKNIVLLFTDMEVIDDLLRLKIKTIGEGKAVVCLDGECQAGEWRKKSASSRTRFFNSDNEEIAFNAGTTWIEVVEEGYEISY